MESKVAGTPRWLGHVLRVRDVDTAAEWYADI
jgi:hypothetical protein